MWYQNLTHISEERMSTGRVTDAVSPSVDPDPFSKRKKPSGTEKNPREVVVTALVIVPINPFVINSF